MSAEINLLVTGGYVKGFENLRFATGGFIFYIFIIMVIRIVREEFMVK